MSSYNPKDGPSDPTSDMLPVGSSLLSKSNNKMYKAPVKHYKGGGDKPDAIESESYNNNQYVSTWSDGNTNIPFDHNLNGAKYGHNTMTYYNSGLYNYGNQLAMNAAYNKNMAQPITCAPEKMEEIAYSFTYYYYSQLNSNPNNMYILYSKEGLLSKPNLNGQRTFASNHEDIKGYYRQFQNVKLFCNVKDINVQQINQQSLLLILINGSFNVDNGDDTTFSQTVVLSGDLHKNKFHIINDITYEYRDSEEPAKSTMRSVEGDDSFKVAIFGIPPMVTEGILREILTQRLKRLNIDGNVLEIVLKPQRNKSSDESSLYAFVKFDSPASVEALLLNGLQIQDKDVTLEQYRRMPSGDFRRNSSKNAGLFNRSKR